MHTYFSFERVDIPSPEFDKIYKFLIIKLFKTRMTTFIKEKLKKSDDQTNIDKLQNIILHKNYFSYLSFLNSR